MAVLKRWHALKSVVKDAHGRWQLTILYALTMAHAVPWVELYQGGKVSDDLSCTQTVWHHLHATAPCFVHASFAWHSHADVLLRMFA